jgi:hypothetical protein
MTREEAIGNLRYAKEWKDRPTEETLDMAIEALKQYKDLLIECYKVLPPVKKTEPSGWIPHKMNVGIHEYIYAQCPICESTHDVKSKYCPSCGNLNGLEWIEAKESEDKE